MKEFFNSRAGVKATAILWTAVAAIWIVLCVSRLAESAEEGLIVLSVITAVLGVINSVIQWTRYANFETETKE